MLLLFIFVRKWNFLFFNFFHLLLLFSYHSTILILYLLCSFFLVLSICEWSFIIKFLKIYTWFHCFETIFIFCKKKIKNFHFNLLFEFANLKETNFVFPYIVFIFFFYFILRIYKVDLSWILVFNFNFNRCRIHVFMSQVKKKEEIIIISCRFICLFEKSLRRKKSLKSNHNVIWRYFMLHSL